MDKPHWHDQNPWKDTLVYVPIEELAACALSLDDPKNRWAMIDVIAHWGQYGEKLDAYILVGCVEFTAGVRYGPEGSHYLSPGFSLPKLYDLLQDYLPTYRKEKKPKWPPVPTANLTPPSA